MQVVRRNRNDRSGQGRRYSVLVFLKLQLSDLPGAIRCEKCEEDVAG